MLKQLASPRGRESPELGRSALEISSGAPPVFSRGFYIPDVIYLRLHITASTEGEPFYLRLLESHVGRRF